MKKRTKIIILTVMVLLLGVTGYLNIVLNDSISTTTTTTTTTTSYFDSYRNDRTSTRDQQLLYYDAIIDSETSTAEAIESATAAREELINKMTYETEIEGLIKGLGYSDCVISIGTSKTTVIVESTDMTTTQANQIAAIVADGLGISAKNIVVIPVD